MPARAKVALALGGNIGDPEKWFRHTIRVFSAYLGGLRVGPLYRSSAVSRIPQPDFLNTAILASADLAAEDLLAIGKAMELAAGRDRGIRHGPRPLDVDLLIWGDRISLEPELRLPHPLLSERRFVLQPLVDLDPELKIGPQRVRAAELLARLPPGQEIRRIPWRQE